jgi:hypothetical protein
VKKTLQFLILIGVLALVPRLLAHAQTPKLSKLNQRTTSIASSAKTRLYARTMTGEDPAFRKAIDSLDAQAGKVMRGVGLVPAAVSLQTKVPLETLVAQHTETGLSYGELLVANSLAVGSNKSFARILAMRAKTLTWAELSLKLRINPNSLIARAQAAFNSINYAQARFDRRRRESVYGLDVRRTQNSQLIPRLFGRGIPGG